MTAQEDLAEQGAELRVQCEAMVENALRDAAQLGWEYAQAGATREQARIAAADAEVQPVLAALVGQIMQTGELLARVEALVEEGS